MTARELLDAKDGCCIRVLNPTAISIHHRSSITCQWCGRSQTPAPSCPYCGGPQKNPQPQAVAYTHDC